VGTANAKEVMLARGNRAVLIENDLLVATVLVDKGADIYQLIYKPKQTDVLWKSPWGLCRPGRSHRSRLPGRLAQGVRGRLAGDLPERRWTLRLQEDRAQLPRRGLDDRLGL
jgi:hypothetical protein